MINKRTQYFGVVGNRDYIKLSGVKLPFWEFLDQQPDGWLTSLTYRRKDLPVGKPMIFDCGAWSYKDQDVPPVHSKSVAKEYAEHAPAGTMVIAPDHMLIDGCNLAFRRRWNKVQAKLFIKHCPDNLVPMAGVHGMDIEERIEHAKMMADIGYKHIAIGGLAARASQKSTVISWVKAIAGEVKGVWIHVLGLSSPSYMSTWRDLGINSCDGSSHFKQAFTGGAFFTHNGDGSLLKHQAARPGNADDLGIVAPECNCKACSLLREDGIDTRSYGSNENNMGRAAHNLNMLMQAQDVAMRRTIVLVACSGKKLTGKHRASELYNSPLFEKSREYALRHGHAWAILSAKHNLLPPDRVVESYNVTLNDMPKHERDEWARVVAQQLQPFKQDEMIVLAGNNYCGWTDGFRVTRPMEGMGIGQQLQWLTNQTEDTEERQLCFFE